jgi:hypothetical protein
MRDYIELWIEEYYIHEAEATEAEATEAFEERYNPV